MELHAFFCNVLEQSWKSAKGGSLPKLTASASFAPLVEAAEWGQS